MFCLFDGKLYKVCVKQHLFSPTNGQGRVANQSVWLMSAQFACLDLKGHWQTSMVIFQLTIYVLTTKLFE